jgi:hemerythrin-like domain-containing protein
MAQTKISREPLQSSRYPAMRPKQDPDLVDELIYEHRNIEHLWTMLERAHWYENGFGTPVDARRLGDATARELGRQLIETMARHERVELDLLYPAAARVMSEEWAKHAQDEHEEIRALLDELHDQDPADDQVFALYTTAMGRLLAHIIEEDKILFPIMRIEIPRGQLTHPGHTADRALLPGHPNVVKLAAAHLELEASPRDNSYDGEVVDDNDPRALQAAHGHGGNGHEIGAGQGHDAHAGNGEDALAGDGQDDIGAHEGNGHDIHGGNGHDDSGAHEGNGHDIHAGNGQDVQVHAGNGDGDVYEGNGVDGGNGKRRRRLLRRS